VADYTILLIDYEPRNIKRTTSLLQDAGFTVEVATDGNAGLRAFETLQPDLVLTEAMIPKKHGFEVCQEIKRQPQGKQVPVVIMTAVYKGRKYRTQALHLYGCDEYIEKPVDDEKLLTICRNLLKVEEPAAEEAVKEAPAKPKKTAAKKATAKAAAKSKRTAKTPEKAGKPEIPELEDAEDEIAACLDAIMPDDGSEDDDTPAALDSMTTPATSQVDADI
jgi:DNA-binding response OmpR family regulator